MIPVVGFHVVEEILHRLVFVAFYDQIQHIFGRTVHQPAVSVRIDVRIVFHRIAVHQAAGVQPHRYPAQRGLALEDIHHINDRAVFRIPVGLAD